jgi:hypothetical protein
MKTKLLVIGFIAGILSGIILATMLTGQKAMADHRMPKFHYTDAASSEWPDSLDAVKADPAHHKIVYENDKVRILEVTGEPFASEPVHTHKWPSVMWSANPNFAKAHMIYYNYAFDSVRKIYFVKDSVAEQGPPANRGFAIPTEGPHRVKNLSDIEILAYRVEFKN